MLFLCYQNKAHHNRQMLTYKIIQSGLKDQGHLTLVQSPPGVYDFPGLEPMIGVGSPRQREFHYEHADLGPLEIWNQCFLNIVSETPVESHGEIFLSEKTFKPIIGFRPFVINGDPRIYQYLRDNGFDIFEDLIPVSRLMDSKNFDQITDVIVDFLNYLKTQDLSRLFLDLESRLCYNNDRFHEFAKDHTQRISNLFR